MKTVCSVVGARPNFMKIALLHKELQKQGLGRLLVHTGQHYDDNMSRIFFRQLGLPEPDIQLGVGSGGHGEMTGKIMIAFEAVCLEHKPDMVLVVGDVNSTLAAALVARKLGIPVAHVEAGLRSFDESMPEELNRRLTDCLSNLLFAPEPAGIKNLQREGLDMSRAHLVGDAMLETLAHFAAQTAWAACCDKYRVAPEEYVLCTMHRPANVDCPAALSETLEILESLQCPVLFPVHPRTLARLREFGLLQRVASSQAIRLLEPLPYLEFLSLMRQCRALCTDSGSVQSEAAFFNVPCLLFRDSTERPVYLEQGTSELVFRDKGRILALMREIEAGRFKRSSPDVLQLGQDVARSIADVIARHLD